MDATDVIRALRAPGGNEDPYPLYARAREKAPVLAGADYHLVTTFAAADEILRSPAFGAVTQNTYARAAGAKPVRLAPAASILRANAPDHRRMRAPMSGHFHTRKIESMRDVVEKSTDELIDAMTASGDGCADFMEHFAYRLPIAVISALLGIAPEHAPRLRKLAANITNTLEPLPSQQEIEAGGAAQSESFSILGEIADARREMPLDDLISHLVGVERDGTMSPGELLANLSLLLVAGFETTSHLLGNGLALLFSHPEIRRELAGDPVLIPQFVGEVLRYDPPVQLATRTPLTDGASVADTDIAEGSMVLVMLGAAGRDPQRYPEPDRFLPFSRPADAHLAFGSGAHYCLGVNLAHLEAEVAFERLLTRLPRIAPSAAPSRRPGRMAIRGYECMPVSF